jgi:hypothetical protein
MYMRQVSKDSQLYDFQKLRLCILVSTQVCVTDLLSSLFYNNNAHRPLNVGPKPSLKGAGGANDDELYGLLTPDWRPNWSDDRLHLMRLLTEAPLPEPPNEAKLAAKSGK